MILTLLLCALVLLVVWRVKWGVSKEHYRAFDTPSFLVPAVDPARLALGRQWLAGQSVTICGLVRDAELTLPRTLDRVYGMASLFREYRIVVLENNSRDRTRAILLEAAQRDPALTVLGCGVNQPVCRLNLPATERGSAEMSRGRVAKMVRLRNEIFDYLETRPATDLVIVWDLDIDGIIYRDGLADTAALMVQDTSIDAVAAHGLRVWEALGSTVLGYGDSYAYLDPRLADLPKAARAAFLAANPGYPHRARPVTSAFGGFTLYRSRALRGRRYGSWVDGHGEVVCEHVGLHRGMRLWVNPRMLHIMLQF